MLPRPLGLTALGLVTALTVLAACSSDVDQATPAPADGSSDHGEIAGATELAEPAVGLTTVDATGAVRHLDLLDESVVDLADLDEPTDVQTDGRFVFVQTGSGVEVVDSGVWTWDHVDHFHYYRAPARPVGRVEGTGAAAVATTMSSTGGGTGVHFDDGSAVMLDTGALADGEVVERYRVEGTPGPGLLVPVGDHALLAEGDRVTVLDADGARGEEHPCPAAAGTIATRVGTVVGCRDGALLAVAGDDGPEVERIPYPDGATAPPATEFAGRDGRPTVAALAGPRDVWLLDTRQRAWSLLRSPRPLATVTAVDDDDEHVLGLTVDGRALVLDGESGDVVGLSEPLARTSLRTGRGVPTLVVDQQRAYLSAPVEKRLHEIDFADGARVSRTFETPTEPLFVAGTGR